VSVYKCRVCGKYLLDTVHCNKPCIYLMSNSQRKALSHLMSALLRHIPHEVDLELDNEGFVDVSELVKAIKERWRNKHLYRWVNEEHVKAVALLDEKGRFEIRDNKIRAKYGHSVKVNLKYDIDYEVQRLYHGTVKRFLESIFRQGLLPGKRMYVHLTSSIDEALSAGKRKGNDVIILEVNVDCLRNHGYEVYRASSKIYLTRYVPPECLRVVKE